MKKIKSKLFISLLTSNICIGSIAGVSVFLCNKAQSVLNNNLNTKSIDSSNVSNSLIANDFRSFDLKSSFQIWNTNKINSSYKNLPITQSDKSFSLNAQMNFLQNENWVNYNSNNLNSIRFDNIKSLSFNKNKTWTNNNLNNAIEQAIKSVWSTNTKYMPRIKKWMFKGGEFWGPEQQADYNYNPNNNDTFNIKKTRDLFGPSLLHNETRKWNYYSISTNTDIHASHWFTSPNPLNLTNINEVVKNTQKHFKNVGSEINLNNSQFAYSGFAYEFPKINLQMPKTAPNSSGGTITATLNLFDNTLPQFQNKTINNKSMNDWYTSNSSDYMWKDNVDQVLGKSNTLNKLENIWVDFSKLITIDQNNTTNYSNSTNDVWTNLIPKIQFGWNTELFSALKEVSNIAKWSIIFYDNWTKISDYSNQLKLNFSNMVTDMFNEKIGQNEIEKYINKVKSSNGINNSYLISNKTANYSNVLKKYNWNFNHTNGSVGTLGIGNVANKMQEKAFVYDYIIPQIFKNDIYAHFQIEGENTWNTNELNTKIFDGKTKSFKSINMIDYSVAKKKLDNNISMYLKNFYMKDSNTSQIIAGKNNVTNNNTLNASNIVNLAKSSSNHKISYDSSKEAMKITWKWNPGLNIVSSVNTNKNTRALDTPWYFVSQFGTDPNIVTKDKWNDLTINSLKMPDLNSINGSYSFEIPKNLSIQWNKFPELIKFSELYKKFNSLFINSKGSKEYYDAKRELDNLGFVYLTVESKTPLNYYLSDTEYKRLQQDNTFIENGKDGNFYKYFVKYSFKSKPLKLQDLSKYLTIQFTSSNEQNPIDKFANKKVSVSFNTLKMSQDLANMKEINQSYFPLLNNSLNEFFDVTYDEFWNEVIKLIAKSSQNTDFKLTPNSFKYSVNGISFAELSNWFYLHKWSYTKNSDTTLKSMVFEASITTKYKELSIQDLSSKINITQGDITVSELGDLYENKDLANELTNLTNQMRIDFDKLITKFKNFSLKINQQKLIIRQLIQVELKKNEALNNKFNAIMEMYETKIKEIVSKIQTNYNEFKENNNYVSNGFVSSSLNKTFNYKSDLILIKNLYEEQNRSLNNILTDANLKNEIKQKIQDLNTDLVNEINDLNISFTKLKNVVIQIQNKNNGLLNYAENLVNFNTNQKISIDLNTENSYLASGTIGISEYWVIDTNYNYQNVINKLVFIENFNKLVNDTLNPIIDMRIDFTEDMFKLTPTGTQITGFVQKYGNKTANISVKYQIGSNKKINKLSFEISIGSNDNISTRKNQLDWTKETLNEIKNITSKNQNEISNFITSIDPHFENIKNSLNLINEMGNVNLPNIFGTSEQASKLDKLIQNYKDINVSKTKLNDGFIGTIVSSIIVGTLGIVGLIIFLLSLRKVKTIPLTEEEKKTIQEAYKEFKK